MSIVLEDSNLNVAEQVNVLFKSSLGFPSTKESTPWFQETSVKYNNYVNGEEILLDEIPSNPSFSVTPNLVDVNVSSTQLATGGYIKEDSTRVIRQYHRLILTPVPNSSNNSYYALDSEGNNILTDGLQFNTKWSGSGNKIYPYTLYTQAFINADSNAPNELGQDSTGGNWLYDLKNGVIFFPDYSSSLCNGTTNKPVFSFYKYIGRKGIVKQIDFKNSLLDIPNTTKKYDKQIVVQTSDNTIHRYDSSTSSWIPIGGSGGGGGVWEESSSNSNIFYNSSGNVGIGTSSPLSHAKLHVKGTLFLGDGSGLTDGSLGGCIDFESRDSNNYSSTKYSSALIGTRTHNDTGGTQAGIDKMEMVFFMGNNADSYGPDRFHFIGPEFRVTAVAQTPTSNTFGHSVLDEVGELYENATPNFIIKSNGSVGIGTTSPDKTLHLYNSSRVDIKFDTGDEDHYIRKDGDYLRFRGHDDSTILFELKNNTNGGNSCNFPSGSVGIGTNSPTSKLHIICNTLFGNDGIKLIHSNGSSGTNIGYGGISSMNTNRLRLGANNTEYMCILNGGNVGIGTNGPTHPLYVYGSVQRADLPALAATYWASSSGVQNDSNGTYNNNMSIKASHGILAMTGFWTKSDERVKKNITEINDYSSLQKVRDISCVSYNYKDEKSRGSSLQVGFIAQQVLKHFPHAISYDTDFIPNKLEKITDASWNETKLFSENLVDVSGVKYRFYVHDISDNIVETELDIVGNSDNSFTFEKKWDYVFCYGKEVNDLHILDKNKLFALNFSATQEIDRIQQQQLIDISGNTLGIQSNKNELELLKLENAELKQENQTLQQRLEAIEKRLLDANI